MHSSQPGRLGHTSSTGSYSVKVAEEEKRQRIINAGAETEQIKLVAEAQAEAYQLISKVIGSDNAALIEIMKLVAGKQVRITPEVMVVGGGSGGMTNALMGTVLKDMLEPKPPQE